MTGARRLTGLVAAVASLAVGLGASSAVSWADVPDGRQGDAVIADPQQRSKALKSGSSETLFTLRLPSGSACPGDSANDDYRVQTFLVPADVDPLGMTYELAGPQGGFGDAKWALYSAEGRPFTQQLTMKNDEPGRPGVIDLLPPFTFPYTADKLSPGTYRIGVACTPMPAWTVDTYWDTTIEVVASPSGDGSLTWKTTSDPNAKVDGSGGSSGRSPMIPVALVVIAGAVAVAFVAARRNRAGRPEALASKKDT